MKKSEGYEKFYEHCFQQIDEMQSARASAVVERFRKSRGLRDEDTLALWNLDGNGAEFLTSGKPRDCVAPVGTQIKYVDALAVVCDEECVFIVDSD